MTTKNIIFRRPRVLKGAKIIKTHNIKWESGKNLFTNPTHNEKVYYMAILVKREGFDGEEVFIVSNDGYWGTLSNIHNLMLSLECCCFRDRHDHRYITRSQANDILSFTKSKFPQMWE